MNKKTKKQKQHPEAAKKKDNNRLVTYHGGYIARHRMPVMEKIINNNKTKV